MAQEASGSVFVDEDSGEPRLVRSAFLFLDILGVSAMALDERAGDHLVDLNQALRITFRDFLADDSPWPAMMLSDSLVLASPTGPEVGDADALNDLLLQTAILQLQLAGRGFFARGAVVLSDIHIHDGMLFGAALVEAYELERLKAINPRVVLSDEAARCLAGRVEPFGTLSDENLLMSDQDGVAFVDYLMIVTDEIDPDGELRRHREMVESKLVETLGNSRRWQKYRWVGEYHNDFGKRRAADPALLIPEERLVPRLSNFA